MKYGIIGIIGELVFVDRVEIKYIYKIIGVRNGYFRKILVW